MREQLELDVSGPRRPRERLDGDGEPSRTLVLDAEAFIGYTEWFPAKEYRPARDGYWELKVDVEPHVWARCYYDSVNDTWIVPPSAKPSAVMKARTPMGIVTPHANLRDDVVWRGLLGELTLAEAPAINLDATPEDADWIKPRAKTRRARASLE